MGKLRGITWNTTAKFEPFKGGTDDPTEWRTKTRPAVSYNNVGVGLELCTGN